jgi:hypothetical protein
MLVVHPTKETSSRILDNRKSGFSLLNGAVGMEDEGGRKENSGAGRKVDSQTKIPKSKVSALSMVKMTQGCDGAPRLGQIFVVRMGE